MERLGEKDQSSSARFKEGVRRLSINRQNGYRVDREELLYLSRFAQPEKQKTALACLVADQPRTLMEVTNRYISTNGERSDFLGFVVRDESPSMAIFQTMPNIASMGREARRQYEAVLKKRISSGCGTILDVQETLEEFSNPFYLPKESIVIGAERSVEKKLLTAMVSRAEKKVEETIVSIRTKMTLIQKLLQPARNRDFSEEILELQRIFRIFRDASCQLEASVYSDALGCKIPPWRLEEIEDVYFKGLQCIAGDSSAFS